MPGAAALRVVLAAVTLALVASVAPTAGAQASVAPTPLVRIPFPQEDGSLTPYTFELGYSLMTLVYDTLLWRDADGVPRPWLASSVDTSADGRRVTVKLAEGARWHDGVPLGAGDVAFTFRYVAEHPHPRFTPALAAVDSVTAPDPSTVVIGLRHPSPGFADQPLADLPILPAHLWRGLPAGRLAPEGLAVGSGPYRMVEHRPGVAYRFEANTDYFRGAPAVTTIEVPVITDPEATLRALERREVDMVPVSLPSAMATSAEEPGIRVVRGPYYLGTVLAFNLRTAPFDRVEVRRALARALDVRRIADNLGDVVPADRGLLHPESAWSSPTPLHAFDETGARSALAGLDLPPMSVLAPDNDPVKREAGRQVALAFERAGVRAEVKELPREEHGRALGEDGSPPSFGVAVSVTPALASYDPDVLRRLFASDSGDGSLNTTGYRSPRFDELARSVAAAEDRSAREVAVRAVLGHLADDVPVVPLFFSTGAFAYRPAVYDGWVFVKGAGILDKRSFVEPRRRPEPQATPRVTETPEPGQGLTLGTLAVGAVAAAVVLAVVGLRRGRS